ncbi:hypothetical protein EVAR_101755_1 [Eumeta japonica]|uniref:Uncharacterized protein n=1 Tax=Eumeta variegata TaxID=151549 RepID=A0A4C1SN06_EUMVA|nr:hypothetical protein EVAR_101755_1 [Eumeta japonica]
MFARVGEYSLVRRVDEKRNSVRALPRPRIHRETENMRDFGEKSTPRRFRAHGSESRAGCARAACVARVWRPNLWMAISTLSGARCVHGRRLGKLVSEKYAFSEGRCSDVSVDKSSDIDKPQKDRFTQTHARP